MDNLSNIPSKSCVLIEPILEGISTCCVCVFFLNEKVPAWHLISYVNYLFCSIYTCAPIIETRLSSAKWPNNSSIIPAFISKGICYF